MTTADEVPDPEDLRLRTWVNGELRQDARTSDLVFGIDELIAFIGETCTLEPGDLILTGTPDGVGMAMDPPQFLEPGDVVAHRDRAARAASSTPLSEASGAARGLRRPARPAGRARRPRPRRAPARLGPADAHAARRRPGARRGHGDARARCTTSAPTDPGLGAVLERLAPWAAGRDPEDEAAAIARVALRDHERARRVPAELTAEMARASSEAMGVWVEAKRRVGLRAAAAAPGAHRRAAPPAGRLLPGGRASLRRAAGPLRAGDDDGAGARGLRDAAPAARAASSRRSPRRPRPPTLPGPFPVARQRELALEIARPLGFERRRLAHGRRRAPVLHGARARATSA